MNNTLELTQKSNDLRHAIATTDIAGNSMTIKIRLNDECKNGHQDFSITGDIYQKGKPKIDRYHISGGCIHEDILKVMPELQIFVNLHLCDYEGIPTYAVENGFYHLTNGFNNVKPEDKNFKIEFCEYYRIDSMQFDVLSTSKNKLKYALLLQSLGILAQWKIEANKAIELMENFTGKKFLIDSLKTQYHAPTLEQINEENKKQLEGYYTIEAENEREKSMQVEILQKLAYDRDKEIKKYTNEYEVKKAVLLIGGKKALDNCIFYNHSNELAFNWRNYDNISNELIEKIKANIILPEGCKIK